MAKIFMIVGNTGSGKSTFSAVLSAQEKAHIFCVDEWMVNLFWTDAPDPPSYEWALERTQRIETQMLAESAKLIKNGVNVILDIGFFAKSQRSRVQQFFKQKTIETAIYYLDVDKDTRWFRVNKRNTEATATFRFHVSEEIFEFCETIFEPLDAIELKDAVILSP
ncbi:MAG: ATP-binding protein [Sneathiella sp.]